MMSDLSISGPPYFGYRGFPYTEAGRGKTVSLDSMRVSKVFSSGRVQSSHEHLLTLSGFDGLVYNSVSKEIHSHVRTRAVSFSFVQPCESRSLTLALRRIC